MTRDINGYNTFGTQPAPYKFSGVLTASSEDTVTVPLSASKWLIIFSFSGGDNVWVAYNETAAFPTGALASTTSEMNPQAVQLNGGDVIHLITSVSATEIGIRMMQLEQ